MAGEKIQPLSGFRDMLAGEMLPREQMIRTIQGVYEGYGFTPLSTPALERHATLTGKYGDEAEGLMYKLTDHGGRLLAMRYDLTVPLARVVAQHRNDITLPYRRYQVGNVWRGESPQAGRFREFMQFDADTVGTTSTLADTEVVAMMSDTMDALGAKAVVKVNNRRILDGLVDRAGIDDEQGARTLITAIDKHDKIGKENVLEEVEASFGTPTTRLVDQYLGITGTSEEQLQSMDRLLGKSPAAQEGIANLRDVFGMLSSSGYESDRIRFDPTIARGLNYYTGIIYETTLTDLPQIGSVCSGGRYDNLVAQLGGPDIPAVGTSVGVDRLFTALQRLGKFGEVKTPSQVLVVNFGQPKVSMQVATELRRAGIPTEAFPDPAKLGKQYKRANETGIPYVVAVGDSELAEGTAALKNMSTGEQVIVPRSEVAAAIRTHIQG